MTAFTSFDDVPDKHYGLVYGDPAWRFKTFKAPAEGDRGRRDAERYYPTMSIEEICALPVKRVAAKDCWLIMWCSWPFLLMGLRAMNAWGFKYSSSFKVWVKLKKSHPPTKVFIQNPEDFNTGTGYTTRKNTEFCLLGRRGSPKRLAGDVRELIVSPLREHSRKPEIYTEIERFAGGPYLELNARTEIPGWDQWGNEIGKFTTAVDGAEDPLELYRHAGDAPQEGLFG